MLSGIQSLYEGLGKSGCYFLSIIHIAEQRTKEVFDIASVAFNAAEKGYITFDFDDYSNEDNFFVKEPAKLLGMLTNESWAVSWESSNYKPKDNEYVIICYKRSHYTHFAMFGFDSLQSSRTVREGYIDSYRIFRKV